MPETQIFMITNFHLAIQDEGSLKRLNFSRNIMENLGKNFIFLTTQYGDDILSANAYDFYSYIKLCITFQNYETIFASKEEANYTFHKVQEVLAINQWSPEIYKHQVKYKEAEALYNKSLHILQLNFT